jgi:metal-sulfur cluster biosynthetic enzyme
VKIYIRYILWIGAVKATIQFRLVYSTEVDGKRVRIAMTMTTPACPIRSYLADEVRKAMLDQFENVQSVDVNVVWEPPWSPQMISNEGKRRLG